MHNKLYFDFILACSVFRTVIRLMMIITKISNCIKTLVILKRNFVVEVNTVKTYSFFRNTALPLLFTMF